MTDFTDNLKVDQPIYSSDPGKIIVRPGRHRKTFDKKQQQELNESIRDVGQLQPGICTIEDDEIILIAGERRLRSCLSLSIPYLYILKEEVGDPKLFHKIELMENLRRTNLTFDEECDAIEELHRIYAEDYESDPETKGPWTMKNTAEILGMSVGTISERVKISQWSKAIPEVAQAKNKTEAKKVIARLEQTVDRKENLKYALAQAKKNSAAVKNDSLQPSKKSTGSAQTDLLLDFNRRCILGDFETTSESFQRESFDLIFFDPPWGVDYDNVSTTPGSKQSYMDGRDKFLEEFPGHVKSIFSLMKPNSHLYLVFGIVHHGFVYDTLDEAGFTTNRMPLFWYKQGSHRTRNPKIWPGRAYEAIAYARKGSKDLAKFGEPDIIPTPMPTSKMKMDHPSAKHPDLIKNLLLRSCRPGDIVLDPMAGSGMFGVVCNYLQKELALDWFQIEKEPNFKDLQLFNLQRGYSAIVSDKILDDEDITYKNLLPGSDEWKVYWDTHPERRDEMMSWMDSLKGK